MRRTDVDVERGADRTGIGPYDSDFRAHCASALGSSGLTYEDCAPAHQYGYDVGRDDRYRGSDWTQLEADTRRRWEERNPGTWDRFKDSIRYAWDRARGERRAASWRLGPLPPRGQNVRPISRFSRSDCSAARHTTIRLRASSPDTSGARRAHA